VIDNTFTPIVDQSSVDASLISSETEAFVAGFAAAVALGVAVVLVAELPLPPQAASTEAIAPASVSLEALEFMRSTPEEKKVISSARTINPCRRRCLQQRLITASVDTGAESTDEQCVRKV
jgi:hypothetical protein